MSPDLPRSDPPVITTSEPGSFAAFTFTHRLPEILDQIIGKNRLQEAEAAGLRELKDRLRSGTVKNCLSGDASSDLRAHMDAAEYATWSREIGRHVGKSWLDLPWYFAESLFYLEILLAWGYYRRESRRYASDPYLPFKEEEMQRPGGALDLAGRIGREGSAAGSLRHRLPVLLQYCLWANRLDLSYTRILERYREHDGVESSRLLVDHTEEATERLLEARRVDLILDNSASELIADLHLALSLLQNGPETQVRLHCKKVPYYVSDATVRDVAETISALGRHDDVGIRGCGRELAAHRERGSLVLRDHYFWNGPLHFPAFPADLREELAGSDLIVLKGDLNYRRLLADRRWPPTADMQSIVDYFPAALVTLRTTKSELVVDLPRETVERLDREEPNWLVEGRYGIIRCCDPRPGAV
ncbi:MAG: protein-glutamate O-methyltransferase family protein [Spirochaetales bacterium]|nr:protein-glutamate O-methyltransferase family protein [Spirochaetales bacterium]